MQVTFKKVSSLKKDDIILLIVDSFIPKESIKDKSIFDITSIRVYQNFLIQDIARLEDGTTLLKVKSVLGETNSVIKPDDQVLVPYEEDERVKPDSPAPDPDANEEVNNKKADSKETKTKSKSKKVILG